VTPDLEKMAARAEMAAGHPTWSVAYAEDVPVLLAEIARLKAAIEGLMEPEFCIDECHWCHGYSSSDGPWAHEEGCPFLLASALLAGDA
jgi:hypothetical protein